MVNGKAYTKQDCYVEALKLDSAFIQAWHDLGMTGGGMVNGKAYTEQACYIQAMKVDPTCASPWINLGTAGGGMVNGEAHTRQECYVEALKLDALQPSALLMKLVEVGLDLPKGWPTRFNELDGEVEPLHGRHGHHPKTDIVVRV